MHELDSLRGLAAATVVLGHFQGAFFYDQSAWYQLLIPPAHAAVILFFVLSGYVLSIPVWRGKQDPYPQYLLKRIFRIYVPYAVAVCLALVGDLNFNGAARPLSPWFYETWHTPVTASLVWAQLFEMSTTPAINTAFWSLRYEMEASIVFPLLCSLLVFLRPWGSFVLACLCAIGGQAIVHYHPVACAMQELGITILWSSCFFFGALVSWKREDIGVIFARIPIAVKWILGVLTFAGYVARPNVIIIPAAVTVILFVEHTGLQRQLSAYPLRYLGRVSYSLYLTHGTVLFALLILLFGKTPIWVLFVIYVGVAMLMAHMFCIWIEEPAMRAGRNLARRSRRMTASVVVG